jgi:uncharacterized protein with HEPN domain
MRLVLTVVDNYVIRGYSDGKQVFDAVAREVTGIGESTSAVWFSISTLETSTQIKAMRSLKNIGRKPPRSFP